jgi:hypothetical protein
MNRNTENLHHTKLDKIDLVSTNPVDIYLGNCACVKRKQWKGDPRAVIKCESQEM